MLPGHLQVWWSHERDGVPNHRQMKLFCHFMKGIRQGLLVSPHTGPGMRKDLRQHVVTACIPSWNATMAFCTQIMYSQVFTFTEYERNVVKRRNAYGRYISFEIVNFLMWSNTKTNRDLSTDSSFADTFHVIALKSVWFANSENENTEIHFGHLFWQLESAPTDSPI